MNIAIYSEDLKLLYNSLVPCIGSRGAGQGHSLLYSVEVNIAVYSEDLKLLYNSLCPGVGARGAGQGHGAERARGAGLVPEPESENEENAEKVKRDKKGNERDKGYEIDEEREGENDGEREGVNELKKIAKQITD